jgi:hypothetical protein
MTLTVRLTGDLETSLEKYCAVTGKTKSLIVSELLAEYLAAHAPAPHDLWLEHRPASGSGRGDLSRRHSAVLKEKLRAKHPR